MMRTQLISHSINTLCTLLISSALIACTPIAPKVKGNLNLAAKVYHVAKHGNDLHSGDNNAPFLTISKAADLAMAGDTIVVHAGIYRERIDPPRGGTDAHNRITYQAAKNEKVLLLGSEKVRGWEPVQGNVWKVVLANDFFANYNPYSTKIAGDWFIDNGRNHHTGAVYENGHWLWESPDLETVLGESYDIEQLLQKAREKGKGNLFSLKSFSVGESKIFKADQAAAQSGIQLSKDSLGNTIAGNIQDGDWQLFKNIDFTTDSGFIRAYAGADINESNGGIIEVRLDALDGEIMTKIVVRPTDSWSDFKIFRNHVNKISGTHDVFLVYRKPTEKDLNAHISNIAKEKKKLEGQALWYASADEQHTTIYAQLNTVDPNINGIEINARESIFYPSKPGLNYITVRGFEMRNAATNWTPPTTEQIASIGTHWSKGWIIEDNTISYARCACMSLGKYGDEYDNTSANSATGYLGTIKRALANGWNKENIGQHLVLNNTLSFCEQAGIVGSMGAAFSKVSGNTLHDIHRQKLFAGYEMAGIKFHAAIDTEISNNTIYNTVRGMWLDWMTQGTRISSNLLFKNDQQDLWLEVNHGPALVDNNVFLSKTAISDWSQGNAFVHNLIAGAIEARPIPERQTPIHQPHSTKIKSIKGIQGGDNRYFNNLFINSKLTTYHANAENILSDNIYTDGPIQFDESQQSITFTHAQLDAIELPLVPIINTDTLGKTRVSKLPFSAPDGSKLAVAQDYFGLKRTLDNNLAGPFQEYLIATQYLKK